MLAGATTLETKDFDAVLRYCELDHPTVQVLVDLTGDGIPRLDSLVRTVSVECGECEPGHKMATVSVGGKVLWSCEECPANNYIVDPTVPDMVCNRCPLGATCSEGQLVPLGTTCLRACYAMSGTAVAYAATRGLCEVRD
eukprot:3662661-Rhodomonas_salina.2